MVAASGSTAYFVEGRYFKVVDISDPRSPRLLAQLAQASDIRAIAVSDGYAYVAGTDLAIIDVHDPSAPVEVGSFPVDASDVAISGHLAYVTNGDLLILDITDPSAPMALGRLDMPNHAANRIAVSGTTVYVAAYEQGLRIVDASNPSAPVQRGSYVPSGDASDIAISGSLAFLATYTLGVRIVDVSNAYAPSEVGFIGDPTFATGVAVSGGLAYVAGDIDLKIYDVGHPTAPRELGALATPDFTQSVCLAGNLALVTDTTRGLRVIDVTDPGAPSETGFYHTPGRARDVSASGSHVFVADDDAGLRVLDVSHPEAPVEAGAVGTPGEAYSVALSGDHAFVADHRSGLRIMDVTDVSAVTELGHVSGHADDVKVSNGYAYFVGSEGLHVVDASDTSAPAEIGRLRLFYGQPTGLSVIGNHAFAADAFGGLGIIDASNPASPVQEAYYSIPFQAHGSSMDVDASGDYAYVVSIFDGLHVLNIRDLSAPSEVGFFKMPTQDASIPVGVAVAEGRAFVLALNGGLRMIDVRNPSSPVEVGFCDVMGRTNVGNVTGGGIAVSGDYAYVADAYDGLAVIDVNVDDDADGRADWSDNCPSLANPDQTDSDGDGKGELCDFTLVAPETATIFPRSAPPPTFRWLRDQHRAFRVEFSSKRSFPSTSLVRSSRKPESLAYKTPSSAKWNAVKKLAPIGHPIYWRVVAKDGAKLVASDQVYSFSFTR